MPKAASIIGQVVLYGAFAAFIGYFATDPKYHQIPVDAGLLKLSLTHLGDRECRKRTPEELEKMPRNMRAPLDCPRERSDLHIQLELDGKQLLDTTVPPTGLYKDGVATVYRRFQVKAGEHELKVRFSDNLAQPGFKYVLEKQVTIKPAQILVVDFNPDQGGLFLH